MKIDCNVARDLLPLVIDQAASAESEQLVQEHLAQCPACTEYKTGMEAALTRQEKTADTERQDFDKAAHRLRGQRRRRIWRNVLLGVLAGVLLVLGGLWGWQRLTVDQVVQRYNGEYSVFLTQVESGEVAVNVDYKGSYLVSGIGLTGQTSLTPGESVAYVCDKRSVIKQYMKEPQQNYACTWMAQGELMGYDEIRQGTPEEYTVIWRKGDAIPAASEELEEYFTLMRAYEALLDRVSSFTYYSREEELEQDALLERMDAVRKTVPEWN